MHITKISKYVVDAMVIVSNLIIVGVRGGLMSRNCGRIEIDNFVELFSVSILSVKFVVKLLNLNPIKTKFSLIYFTMDL